MKSEIRRVLISHLNKVNGILETPMLDIILYGSTVTGDFKIGKGDVDFICFIEDEITQDLKKHLFLIHDTYRYYDDLYSRLEGVYYRVSNGLITGGVYIGSSRSGWKIINEVIHDPIEQGLILQNHESLCGHIEISQYMTNDPDRISEKIKANLKSCKRTLETIKDKGFSVHVCHSTARSIYYLQHGHFTSKSGAMDYVMTLEQYQSRQTLLNKLKDIRAPYKVPFSTVELMDLNTLNQDLMTHLERCGDVV